MKLELTTDEGTVMTYEGDDADNMMFFSTVGSEFFNTIPILCVLKEHHNTLQKYIDDCCSSDSFRDMFLRAVRSDSNDDWNALVERHYGGRAGLVALAQDLADKLRQKSKTTH